MPHSPCTTGRHYRALRFPNAAQLADATARLLAEELARRPPGPAALLLSGGRTPLHAYQRLANRPPPVDPAWRISYSDDRHVPPDDPRSNYLATRPLLRALALPADRVLRVAGERPLAEAADAFHQAWHEFLSAGGILPLALLGLGADGHTASLFSADDVQAGRGRWAQAVARPDGLNGVSVTADLLARVQRVIFLVTGPDKRPRAAELLAPRCRLPAALAVSGCPRVEVWLDAAAWPLDPPAG